MVVLLVFTVDALAPNPGARGSCVMAGRLEGTEGRGSCALQAR